MVSAHADVIRELAAHFRPVFEASPNGVYLWLDPRHSLCNERLAQLFGYTVAEWCAVEDFLGTFIVPEDQAAFGANYEACVARLAYPVTFRFRGVCKDGGTFAAETDMIPLSFAGHTLAYHFVRRVGN